MFHHNDLCIYGGGCREQRETFAPVTSRYLGFYLSHYELLAWRRGFSYLFMWLRLFKCENYGRGFCSWWWAFLLLFFVFKVMELSPFLIRHCPAKNPRGCGCGILSMKLVGVVQVQCVALYLVLITTWLAYLMSHCGLSLSTHAPINLIASTLCLEDQFHDLKPSLLGANEHDTTKIFLKNYSLLYL